MKLKLSELRQIIKEEAKKILEADIPDYHQVEYYAEFGEHGDMGDYPNFNTAYKKAVDLYNKEKKQNKLDKLWYIGVSGNTDDFAVVYVTQDYLNKVVGRYSFSDTKAYNNFVKVAKQVLKTGKPIKGKY